MKGLLIAALAGGGLFLLANKSSAKPSSVGAGTVVTGKSGRKYNVVRTSVSGTTATVMVRMNNAALTPLLAYTQKGSDKSTRKLVTTFPVAGDHVGMARADFGV